MFNNEAFDELPADLQAICKNAADAAALESHAQFDYFNARAMTALKAEGVEFRAFPDDVVAAMRGAWAEVQDERRPPTPTSPGSAKATTPTWPRPATMPSDDPADARGSRLGDQRTSPGSIGNQQASGMVVACQFRPLDRHFVLRLPAARREGAARQASSGEGSSPSSLIRSRWRFGIGARRRRQQRRGIGVARVRRRSPPFAAFRPAGRDTSPSPRRRRGAPPTGRG